MKDNNQDEIVYDDVYSDGDEKSLKDKIKALKEELDKKEKEAKENLDGWQRARAELVNKDKQLQQERIEIYKSSSSKIIEELLPILDSYNMARKNKTAWEEVSPNWRMGIEYIFQQLMTVLNNENLVEINPKQGDSFDVNNMSAISEEETDNEEMDHKVAETISIGYSLNGKVLREAKVKIYIKK